MHNTFAFKKVLKKYAFRSLGITGLSGLFLVYEDSLIAKTVTEAEHGLHSPSYNWEHNKMFRTFDHASIRRGFQVYTEVCASCHSLERIAWRNLVGVSHTASEAKSLASEIEYDDEPDDLGNLRKRPGRLSDYLPSPYPNEEAARAANLGALPPDLSLIVKARHGGSDYIFSLLTGYPDELPPGLVLPSGANYNPYFPGGYISMARVLYDDLVEYEDSTPATTSQMAKDVTTFLNWCAEPELDDRKAVGLKGILILTPLLLLSMWLKKFKWQPIKHRKFRLNLPDKNK